MEKIEVTIINWDKFNPRKDVKVNHWFRLDNTFIDSPDFYDFTAEEKLVWILILSLASKKCKGVVSINFSYAERACGLSRGAVETALKKLNDIGCAYVDVTRTLRGRDVDVPLQTNKQTNKTNKTNKDSLQGGSKDPTPAAQLRILFLSEWEKEFGKAYPGWGAKENGQATAWLKSVTLQDALGYVQAYPRWNDPWITRNGHPWGLLVSQYVKLDAWMHRPESVIRKMAAGRVAENNARVLTEEEERLEAMKAYARRDNPELLPWQATPGLNDFRNGQQGSRAIPHRSQAGVPEERGEPDDQYPMLDTPGGEDST